MYLLVDDEKAIDFTARQWLWITIIYCCNHLSTVTRIIGTRKSKRRTIYSATKYDDCSNWSLKKRRSDTVNVIADGRPEWSRSTAVLRFTSWFSLINERKFGTWRRKTKYSHVFHEFVEVLRKSENSRTHDVPFCQSLNKNFRH